MAKIAFVGDFAPTCRIKELLKDSDFSFLNEVQEFNSKVDYAVVNLEAPIAKGNTQIKKNGPHLRSPENIVDAIKYAGFNMATLANNHIRDYGSHGILNTISALGNAGIDYVGAGSDMNQATEIKYREIGGRIVAFINCCEHEFSINTNGPTANPLNPVSQYYDIVEAKQKADQVFVIVHGGSEQLEYPTSRMIETYRFFIDAGASAVVNHHQHIISGYEVYNGCPIFYGLGNFCFDRNQKTKGSWEKGLYVIIDTEDLTFELKPFVQFAESQTISFINPSAFDSELDYINKVIGNHELLNEKVSDFYNNVGRNTELCFEPYANRYLDALFRRGLIPSITTKKAKLRLINNIECESHRDLLQYISNKFKSN